MNAVVWWESQLERDYLYLLEIDPNVLAYQEQPFTLAYESPDKRKKYTPDFFVERYSSKQVVEIKPANKVEDFRNSRRFSQVIKFCSVNSLEFLILTEDLIRIQPRLSNIKLLYKYAQISFPWSLYANCFDYLSLQKISTISETEESLRTKGMTRSCLLKLLWDGFLLTDLMKPISSSSPIKLSSSAFNWKIGAEI